jgi:hypothetical protein
MAWQQWFGSNGSDLLAALFKTKKPQCRALGLLCCCFAVFDPLFYWAIICDY